MVRATPSAQAASLELPLALEETWQTAGIIQADPSQQYPLSPLPALDTYDKLKVLLGDQRAGFLPTTHLEKSTATDLLHFVDGPRTANRLDERLQSIFYSQQRTLQQGGQSARASYGDGLRSVQSVIHVWADFLQNSRRANDQLTLLKESTDAVSPRISFAEAVEDLYETTPDYNFLVRFIDLSLFDKMGAQAGFDPLHVRQNRTIQDETRNKLIEDVYTAHDVSPRMQRYINSRILDLPMRAVRLAQNEAIADQLCRGRFWNRVLMSVEGDFASYAHDARSRAIERPYS